MTTPTVDFSSGYQAPGVYVSEDVSPIVSVNGLAGDVIALVGPSVGFETYSEQVVLGTGVFLSKLGIDTSTIAVSRVDTGEAAVVTTDFTVHVTGDPSTTQNYTVDLTRYGTTGVLGATDVAVFVSYQYTDPDYFTPTAYSNFEDIKAVYGQPLNLTAQTVGDSSYQPIVAPIVLAASAAFASGASQLVLVPTAPPGSGDTTGEEISNARREALVTGYESIATNPAITIVVPLTDGILDADAPGTFSDLRQHCENASADGYYRIGMLGFDAAVQTAPDVLLNTASIRSKRVCLCYAGPQGMSYYNGATNSYLNLGHQYLAAALSGILALNPVQQGLTRQLVSGFSGIAGTPIANSVKNQYSGGGVLVVEQNRNSQTVCRHGTTTDTTNVNTRELSVVRARDAMISFIQGGIDGSALIGSPIESTTLQSVKAVVSGFLEHLVLVATIVSYTALQVRLSSTDPSVIEVRFGYQPAYSLNYITVIFSINIQTGTIDDGSQSTDTTSDTSGSTDSSSSST